ncbi:unnamed protein product [Schistosoma curassoni]|uniref:Transposase n=1 Tax=Schistosoma curassoni TaxID=6186 RepID=A0A183KPF0_9TREM|nr:unnamed protein product [Schistosoma curassoni]
MSQKPLKRVHHQAFFLLPYRSVISFYQYLRDNINLSINIVKKSLRHTSYNCHDLHGFIFLILHNYPKEKLAVHNLFKETKSIHTYVKF